jgi:hypothetical protein
MKRASREWEEFGFSAARSTFGYRMPTASLFTVGQELIVQSIDLARLIGLDIVQMQGSQLMLGWLVVNWLSSSDAGSSHRNEIAA